MKVVDDIFLDRIFLLKLYVSDIFEDVILEMLRVYFEGFGFIAYLGFINYYFEKVVLILIGVFVVFCEEEVLEKVLNRIIYEVNGCKLKV